MVGRDNTLFRNAQLWEIVEQLESRGFTCEGGKFKNKGR